MLTAPATGSFWHISPFGITDGYWTTIVLVFGWKFWYAHSRRYRDCSAPYKIPRVAVNNLCCAAPISLKSSGDGNYQ
jgi:hypothetical protein